MTDNYTLNQKIDFVKFAIEQTSILEAARSLRISYNELKKWVDKYGDVATDPKHKTTEDAITALRKSSSKRGPKPKEKLARPKKGEKGKDGLTLVERCKKLRKSLGLSGADVADLTGLSPSTIINSVGCHIEMSDNVLNKLVELFGVSVGYLLWGVEESALGTVYTLVEDDEKPAEVKCVNFKVDDAPIPDPNNQKPVISFKDPETENLKEAIKDLKSDIRDMQEQIRGYQDQQMKMMQLCADIMQTQQEQARQYIAFRAKANTGTMSNVPLNTAYASNGKDDNFGNKLGDNFNRDFTKKV